jgi:excisionase family DNA binding protein
MSHLLDVSEIAEALKVPKSWIYSRTRETGPDAMPKVRVGKYLRFVREDVFAWLQKRYDVDEI